MDKNVFVTGAAGGLGLALVRKHLSLGDKVWALDINEIPALIELAATNSNVVPIKCDISKTENVQSALTGIAQEIGTLNYFYNCAAIYRFEDKVKLQDTILDNAAIMYEINAIGFLRVAQALLDTFKDGSVVINVTSEAGSIGNNYRDIEYNYCLSKTAQNMAGSMLQKHFDNIPQNTRVICIHPGWLRTAMGGKNAFDNPDASITPENSAEAIVSIALDIDNIDKNRMYMTYDRTDLRW